ncbi:hypothetical protein I3842_05G233400 [Carya illinoinensis]|uniref:Protein kinase domain-containing protein n=1 Tax=Carya illinoinensis TaxID=32201 RepID=A0A922JP66_CARIL|nr:hypothetical protein I3842_05G233400 [Carya illinoinensis]
MASVSKSSVFFLLSYLVLLCSAKDEDKECTKEFDCGILGKLHFPFSNTENPVCGLFIKDCETNTPKIQVASSERSYEVVNFSWPDVIGKLPDASNCSIVQLPRGDDDWLKPFEFVLQVLWSAGFKHYCWKCHRGGGYCRDLNGSVQCVEEKKHKRVIPLVILSIGIGVLTVVIIYCLRKKFSYFWKKESVSHQNIEDFLKSFGPLAIRRYSYSEIKKMTNFFKEKLGQGGYGGVYKGNLQDGCLVAVKVLRELRANGEEFINEVVSISRTSHVNIVTLMGFFFSDSKRALIYEFMPNGSLEKFIFKKYCSKDDYQLDWKHCTKLHLG